MLLLMPWLRKRLLDNPKRLGRWGQNRSEKYLSRRGCRTIARNYAFSGGELDLVMADTGGAIVFVEVKTRQSEDFAPAKTAVNYDKQKKMIRTAKRFLREFNISDRPLRFDVMTVILGPKGAPVIQHYPNAFVP
jgi:putative endonuclease